MRALLIVLVLAVASESGGEPLRLRSGQAPQSKATFAGGCFWSVESVFEKVPGVISVTSGYTGGTTKNPTYNAVSFGGTGHREAVEVIFDPKKISYAQLLNLFWRNIDPTDMAGQFCDKGDEYRTAVFFHDEAQHQLALASKPKNLRVVTEIRPAAPFYRAEEFHQDYAAKNPVRYKLYRFNCGRDARLKELWGSAR